MAKVISGNPKVDAMIEQMSMEEKLLLAHGQMCDKYNGNQAGFVNGNERLGIPDVFIADGEYGVNHNWETTILPCKTALAATFDTGAAQRYGEVIGKEAKATGMHVMLTPRVNIIRDYVAMEGMSNGGNYQTFSEDPTVCGKMGAAEAKGIEGDNKAIANLKQIFGSSSGTAQGAGNCIIDEQTIHEIYLKAFEIVTKAGIGSAMSNYNQVNGKWTYEADYVFEDLMRNKWGFKGFVFDDWLNLHDPNAIAKGVTMEMPGEDFYGCGSEKSWYGKKLEDAIADPSQPVTAEHLNRAVSYYLDTLDRYGMLDEPQRIPGPLTDEKLKMESAEEAKRLSMESAVLLKNNGILPIDIQKEKIAIIGPTGNRQVMPIFKEGSYGFADRKTGTLQVLRDMTDREIEYAVGNDLDGEVIPGEYLKTEDGRPGLERYTGEFPINTLAAGVLPNAPRAENPIVDAQVLFVGDNALPRLPYEAQYKSITTLSPPYYMWKGKLQAPETGMYRLSLQSYIPAPDVIEKNNIKTIENFISTSGNLYLRKNEGEAYTRIGIGTRVAMNGYPVPNSEVVECMDGFNNAGSTVMLEAGKEYDIYLNACSVSAEPVQLRLCWTTPSMMKKAIQEAAEVAKRADKSIVFAWHKSPTSKLELQENQNELINAVSSVNPNTVVVLNTGDPVAMPWLDKVGAVLEMWISGQEGARATADVLTGAYNPGGKLPITFPKRTQDSATHDPAHPERWAMPGRGDTHNYVHENVATFSEGVNMGYRHFDENSIEPLFPFGYGLSYTTFEYSEAKAEKDGNGYKITCKVRNTGKVTGDEVVQVYVTRPETVPEGVQASPKVLADFARVNLQPGEEKTVTLSAAEDQLFYYSVEQKGWEPLKGEREVLVAASSRDIRHRISILV